MNQYKKTANVNKNHLFLYLTLPKTISYIVVLCEFSVKFGFKQEAKNKKKWLERIEWINEWTIILLRDNQSNPPKD